MSPEPDYDVVGISVFRWSGEEAALRKEMQQRSENGWDLVSHTTGRLGLRHILIFKRRQS